MSTQEIREALEAHAQFDDTAALARLGSVKARVRVVRRRRRAALAGAAAAVVATVGGIATVLPGDGEVAPASRTFAGMTAPATMTSLGNTYSFVSGASGEGEVSVEPAVGDVPVLVTWADAGKGALTVDEPISEEPWTSTLKDFTDFVVLEHEFDEPVVVRGKGEVVVAVYKLSALAEGVDGGRYGFPQQLAEQHLIAGEIGQPGETEVTVRFRMPQGRLVMRELCAGAAEGYAWRQSFEVRERHMSSQCPEGTSVRHEAQTSYPEGIEIDGRQVKPGEWVTARIWLVESFKAPDGAGPVTGPSGKVQLGLAFYEDFGPDTRDQLAVMRIHDGRTWALQDHGLATREGRDSQHVVVEDGPKLVVALVQLDSPGTVIWSRDGVELSGQEHDVPGGSGLLVVPIDVLHDGSATYEMRIEGSQDKQVEMGFATYVLQQDTDEVRVAE